MTPPSFFVDPRCVRDEAALETALPGRSRMTIHNITKDSMYDAVAPDDFESMLTLDRYGQRSTAFDKIISATHDHFWDPLDKKYIDFDEPWDMMNDALVSEELNIAIQTEYVSNHLKDP